MLTHLTDIDETHFRVAVALDLPNQEEDDESSKRTFRTLGSDPFKKYADPTEPATLLLSVTYPEEYPDVAPHLDISNLHDGPKVPGLDLANDKAALLKELEPTIEESLGIAMIFSIVSTLKDAAEQLIGERAKAAERVREAELRAAEEKENAKFHGEKVTKESFLQWRDSFRQEMAEKAKKEAEEEAAASKRGGKSAGASTVGVGVGANGERLTGKQLWEQGKAGKIDEKDDEWDSLTLVEKEVGTLKIGKGRAGEDDEDSDGSTLAAQE